jgi:aminoglycoside phosphotransferase family enzyme/predicted kinase
VTVAVLSEQSETLRFLAERATYGTRSPVHRIDTHGAIVFLAGDRAYKLKRAVRLPYLDFSTSEKRFAACAAEIAVNRRTAPDLYLGVAPVRAMRGALSLGPVREPRRVTRRDKGRAVDWVVVMRRFSDDAVYDRIAARGSLDQAEVAAIAEAIARFHIAAPKVASAARSRSIAWVIRGNDAAIATHVPRVFRRSDARMLARRSQAALRRVAALLARRRRQGFVRHVHGDLHLRNICRIDGRPVLFDALEFDTRLATVDVLYDLAFLLMDMVHRRLHIEANRLLNDYLARVVDPEDPTPLAGLAALPLFMSARAAIRAHTEATAANSQANWTARVARIADARRYLALACGLLQPSAPVLVAIGGLSGSGKTTLARALAPSVGAAPGALVLRSDTIRKRLAGVDALSRLPPETYTKHASAHVYRTIEELTLVALRARRAVIADAVFADTAERAAIEAVARRAGVPFIGIWLEAPQSTMTGRLVSRRGDASDATPAVLARQLTYDLGDITWKRLAAGRAAKDVVQSAHRVLSRNARRIGGGPRLFS